MRQYTKQQLENFTILELELFSENQLKVLTIEDLKSDLIMQKNSKSEDERIVKFWQIEYSNLSIEEKVRYWAAGLYKSMRDQEENGLKVYVIYTETWLTDTLEKEPHFIEFLPEIYNIWGGMFDANKVDNIIKRHLKNIEKR
jgi:hypothetical protein